MKYTMQLINLFKKTSQAVKVNGRYAAQKIPFTLTCRIIFRKCTACC